MRWGVEQPIARHDAILADTSGPAMPQDIARLEVDELGPSPAHEDIPVGGFVKIASMVVFRILGFDVHQHFTGGQVTLRRKVRAPRRPSLCWKWLEPAQPERAAGNEQVPNIDE
jgi:hypothetical protein